MALLAERLSIIKPSPTLTLTQQAADLKASGVDIISLTAGEPDFNTPEWICAAATGAMDQGQTGYTAVNGTVVLRQAVKTKFAKENQLHYDLNEIIVSTGAKQIIFNAFIASLNPGDEVIIPAPYWVSYADIILLADGTPIIVECTSENDFKISATQLVQAITPRTKWFLINSPCNPTGMVYSQQELQELGDVLINYPHIYIMSDDIYEHILYTDDPFTTIAQVVPQLQARTLTINGVSKSYAMTGWRIGYAGGPKDLIQAMGMIQSQSTSNACSIAQAATVAALNGPQDFRESRAKIFQERRDFIVGALNQISGITCASPQGAFYVYANCQGLLGKQTAQGRTLHSDADVADYLLQDAGVAVVPGDAFGLSPYFRASYACEIDLIQQACTRIARSVDKLI